MLASQALHFLSHLPPQLLSSPFMLWQKSHEVYHLSYFCYLLNVSYSVFENFIHTYLDHIHCHPLSLHPPVFKRIVQSIKAVTPGLATCHKTSSSSQVEASSSAENLLVSNIDTYPSHWCPSCPVDTMTLGSLRSGIPQECVSPCDRPVSVSTIALRDIPISVGITTPSLSRLDSAVCMATLLLLSFVNGH